MEAALHVVLLSALFVVLAGNSGSCGGSAETVSFTLLHTNDIHSHTHEAKAGTELNPFNLGGLARIKTLADRIRAAKPNVFMLDAGDWSEGTMPFTNDVGANMLRFMDAMGYNASMKRKIGRAHV